MSTQNIWDNEDVLKRYERVLIEQGKKYMLKRRFNLGHFNLRKLPLSIRLAEILCQDECNRLPFRHTTKELLNKLLINA